MLALTHQTDFIGGGEYSLLGLLTHLPKHMSVYAGVPRHNDLSRALKQAGIPVLITPMPRMRSWRLRSIFQALRALCRECRRHAISVIYANSSRAALYGGIVAVLMRVPLVWHCRVADKDPILDRLLVRLATAVVVNSRATAARFGQKGRAKLRVVYNGVDIAWLTDVHVCRPTAIPTDWKILLIPARVSHWKRHDRAISIFEWVAGDIPDLHLVCVGAKDIYDDGWWQVLQTRTIQSQFADRIHWIGGVSDIRPWYRAADVMLLPSDNEPFGRVIVEAMASGVPVIATRSGGIPEIIRNPQEGILFESGDTAAAAEAVRRVLLDSHTRQQLVQCARKRAEDFSLKKHVRQMYTIFAKVLQRRNLSLSLLF